MTGRRSLTREAMALTFVGGIAFRRLRNHPARILGNLPFAAEIPPTVGSAGRLLVRARLVRGTTPALESPRAWSAMVRETAPIGPVQVALRDATDTVIHLSEPLQTDGAGMVEAMLDAPPKTVSAGLIAAGVPLPQRARVRIVQRDTPLLAMIADVDRTFLGSDLEGFGDLADLMWEPGASRPWIEGTAALANRWRDLDSPTLPRAWVFLTGSPWFFLGNLSDAAQGVGLTLDGLFPRPGPVPGNVPPWDPDHVQQIFRTLSRQAGYKLSTCLRFASTLPEGSRLVLLGDDAESDALAYTALSRRLDRSWSDEEVLARVLPRAGSMWGSALEAALEETRDLVGPTVAFIGIRRTARARHPEDLADLPTASAVHDTTAELEAAMKQHKVW